MEDNIIRVDGERVVATMDVEEKEEAAHGEYVVVWRLKCPVLCFSMIHMEEGLELVFR
jgi:hypothetical protein